MRQFHWYCDAAIRYIPFLNQRLTDGLTTKATKGAISSVGKNNSTTAVTIPAPVKLHTGEDSETEKIKSPSGWPTRKLFYHSDQIEIKNAEEWIYFSELTWSEKMAFRKRIMKEYFSETVKCFPHLKRLVHMIVRISPWRVLALIALKIISGFVPALTLQAKGRFILMVCRHFRSPLK